MIRPPCTACLQRRVAQTVLLCSSTGPSREQPRPHPHLPDTRTSPWRLHGTSESHIWRSVRGCKTKRTSAATMEAGTSARARRSALPGARAAERTGASWARGASPPHLDDHVIHFAAVPGRRCLRPACHQASEHRCAPSRVRAGAMHWGFVLTGRPSNVHACRAAAACVKLPDYYSQNEDLRHAMLPCCHAVSPGAAAPHAERAWYALRHRRRSTGRPASAAARAAGARAPAFSRSRLASANRPPQSTWRTAHTSVAGRLRD